MSASSLPPVTEKKDFAYEIKFLVSDAIGEQAIAWARTHLQPDPNGLYSSDGYRVNSLYFDTAALDVYHRRGSFGRSKYRIRRYGTEQAIFLERKLKTRGLVGKRRTRLPEQDILFVDDMRPSPKWSGHWFRRRLELRKLAPRCQITYDRVARVGPTPEGLARMTVDRNLRAVPMTSCRVLENHSWVALLPGKCILELKFPDTMPMIFKQLVEQLGVSPQAFSKYRLSVDMFGWAAEAKTVPLPDNAVMTAAASARATA